MTDARRLPDKIQWHEGMLLSPQHFQQFSLRMDELVHYHVAAAAPFHWGVRTLKIDPVLLIEGTFRVQALEAVMPDGLVVYHGAGEEAVLDVDLTEFVEEMTQEPLAVHLAVPAQKNGNAVSRGVLARYDSVEGAPFADENTGETEVVIPRLVPRVILLTGETPPQKYCSFPLAQISYQNETFALTEYVPPTLAVAVKSDLGQVCANISRRLREKATFLSERINSPASTIKGPMTLETKLMIHAMISGLPAFEGLLNTGCAHPYALYLALCQIVGNLSALGVGMIPPVMQSYNHNDPQAAFNEAQAFSFRMVDEGIVESHTAVPFDFENGVFSLKLKKIWASRTLVIGVRGRPDMNDEMVMVWMAESLIGSREEIESMKEKRIRGASREKIEGDAELVPARGVTLYAVKTDPEFIQADRILQVVNTSDPKNKRGPAEVTLYIKNTL
jgi:type VI secretion system protein ImpJ